MRPLRIVPRHDGAHLRLILDQPKGNVITAEMVAALRASLADVRRNAGVRLVTLEGAGGDFSFGASIPEHLPEPITRVLPEMHGLIRDLLVVQAPTAAVVRGRCLGGGFELALACDFILASDDAVMGVPEILLGVFPPAAATLLPVRVGAARAASAVLTGEARPAAYWAGLGLVETIVPSADLEAEVDRWYAAHFEPRSGAALAHAALAARAAVRAAVQTTLPQLERLYLDRLMKTHDAVEGITAYLDKRPPRWRHA